MKIPYTPLPSWERSALLLIQSLQSFRPNGGIIRDRYGNYSTMFDISQLPPPEYHGGDHLFQGGYHYYSDGEQWIIIESSTEPMHVDIDGSEKEAKCTCGSDSCGSPKHSHYCKKYKP